jgi:hypothetical protein
VEDVLVVLEDTTSNVDFALQSVPDIGYIEGYVTLVNGTGDVTLTEVTAGMQLVHPTADGHYFLGVEPGTYTVSAIHPYTLPDSITGVTVTAGQTISDVDFELELIRADLVCKAIDTYNNVLNNINVEVDGPEGSYAGEIVNDSLVFENVPYGAYSGSAWMYGEDPVYADTVIGADNHMLIFIFDLTGFQDLKNTAGTLLKLRPNPFHETASIEFSLNTPGEISLKVYSMQGLLVKNLSEGWLNEGKHIIAWDGTDSNGASVCHGLYMIMLQTAENSECVGIIRN